MDSSDEVRIRKYGIGYNSNTDLSTKNRKYSLPASYFATNDRYVVGKKPSSSIVNEESDQRRKSLPSGFFPTQTLNKDSRLHQS